MDQGMTFANGHYSEMSAIAMFSASNLLSGSRRRLDFNSPKVMRKRPRVQKSVRFDEGRNMVCEIMVDQADLKRAWMQPEEYEAIRLGARYTILAIKNAERGFGIDAIEDVCIRGLEGQILVYVYKTDRKKYRKQVQLVVDEHKFQRSQGFENDESIRALYATLTRESLVRALDMAKVDELHARHPSNNAD
jgi:hypothetical protein